MATPVSVDNLATLLPLIAGNGGMASGDAMVIPITIKTSDWNGSDAIISCEGIAADEATQLIYIFPASASLNDYQTNAVGCVGQGENSLTFKCVLAPSVDLDIFVIINKMNKKEVSI